MVSTLTLIELLLYELDDSHFKNLYFLSTLDSILSEIEMEIAQRNRSGSVNSRDAVVGTSSGSPVGSAPNSNTENKLENQLYDKYLAK